MAKNTPIKELLEQYEAEGCDFSDIDSVCRMALRYVLTMEDSQARCLLYVLAQKVEDLVWSGVHTCHDQCQKPMCVQRREIERLQAEVKGMRTALRKIAKLRVRDGSMADAAKAVALAALTTNAASCGN